MVEKPFEYALDRVVSAYLLGCATLDSGLQSSGLSATSMVSEGLARFQGDPTFELAIKESSATAFGGLFHSPLHATSADCVLPAGSETVSLGHNWPQTITSFTLPTDTFSPACLYTSHGS